MKKWMCRRKGYIIGAALGGLAGLLYWKDVGCVTGTCAISANPLNSSLYFALTGAVLTGSFRKNVSEKISPADEGK